jgi:large subunit ribosomal protein L28
MALAGRIPGKILDWGLAFPWPIIINIGFLIGWTVHPNAIGAVSMSRVCYFTGRRTVAGRSIARRGKAKRQGGVGKKTTGISKRKFKPNIQRVRAVIDGKLVRVKVSTKAMRMGLITKPVKRVHRPAEKVAS